MTITFLGTGTSHGVPMIGCKCEVCLSSDHRDKRLRSSIWIKANDLSVVIDTGPDFRTQMLRANVTHLDAVLLTHEHKDHLAGFDDIRAFNYMQKQKMEVYATAHVQEAIRREFPYIFADFRYPGIPEITLHTIDQSPFAVKGVSFLPISVMHYLLPVTGFRVGDFVYITDANFIDESEKDKIRGADVLVINALRREQHISHFTLEQALQLIQELKVKKAYLTHISHQLGTYEKVQAELPSNVFMAYDGLELQL